MFSSNFCPLTIKNISYLVTNSLMRTVFFSEMKCEAKPEKLQAQRRSPPSLPPASDRYTQECLDPWGRHIPGKTALRLLMESYQVSAAGMTVSKGRSRGGGYRECSSFNL